jgi:hypothetical protein
MDYSWIRDIRGMMILKYIWLIMIWGYWMKWYGPVIGQNIYGTQWPRACNESVHSWLPDRMECSRGLWREVPSCQELFLSRWCDGMCVTSWQEEAIHSRRDSMQVSGIPRHSTAGRNSYFEFYVTCVLVYGEKGNSPDVLTLGTFHTSIKMSRSVGCTEEHCLET